MSSIEQIVGSSASAPRRRRPSASSSEDADLPVYEPNREQAIFDHVRAANPGPLPDTELLHIYERIIDVMRALQRELATP